MLRILSFKMSKKIISIKKYAWRYTLTPQSTIHIRFIFWLNYFFSIYLFKCYEFQLNNFIFNQLPELFILEIVRPNWDLTEKIGTHLNVSHLGFAFKKKSKPENKNDQWIFRHASSEEKKVVDVSLENYLKRYLHHETVKGINVQEILFPTS